MDETLAEMQHNLRKAGQFHLADALGRKVFLNRKYSVLSSTLGTSWP